ncbi:MAG: imidazole glycerol phosphate synthase cyclase subunit [Candidatus Omnitrophica bacterium]|nr:imidazole glycerol phosphate synthase cyclase subunit [Candidatus Omnitrophota bacterium]MBU1995860.1 imidazole glycerol phosphate synthase cyclase subunit [Candidatus Omnitrophota bacterium]MBU4334688.1 imidazole glycerol phosphate synthase cyclase subunit [Candidatus Omnitrophota bacterium]
MLKKRIVACLIIKNGIVVQSIGFEKYLPVGRADIALEALNMWGIDEIVLLDIDATREKRVIDLEWISKITGKILTPLTIGGGIKTIEDMRRLIHFGADKVSLNKTAIENPDFIAKASKVFGQQCVVVSMDVKKVNGKYEVFSDSGKTYTGYIAEEYAKVVEGLGAGEIFLNSIDCDGAKNGFDIDLINKISQSVSIPVIACGGAGCPGHFLEVAEKTNASAIAAGNFFHFTEHSPIVVKSYLDERDVELRLDSYANYRNCQYDQDGRIAKRDDKYLYKLRFELIKDEVV